MATGHGQQVMAGGVRQYGLDVHAQWALVVEGDGGAVMLGEFDFALAVQRQGAAGQAQAMGYAGRQGAASGDAAALQQAGCQWCEQRLFSTGVQAYPGTVRVLARDRAPQAAQGREADGMGFGEAGEDFAQVLAAAERTGADEALWRHGHFDQGPFGQLLLGHAYQQALVTAQADAGGYQAAGEQATGKASASAAVADIIASTAGTAIAGARR